jgi:hypothetical protein
MRPDRAEDRLPAGHVLRFLGETLRDMARRIEGVEAHVGGVMDPKAPKDRVRLMAMQDLDLIRQMAEDAARVAEIAVMHEGTRRAELASGVRLAALRDRLLGVEAGEDRTTRGAGAPDDQGRVEFFSAGGAS